MRFSSFKFLSLISCLFLFSGTINGQTIQYKGDTIPIYTNFDTIRPIITGQFSGKSSPLYVSYLVGQPENSFDDASSNGIGRRAYLPVDFRYAYDKLGNSYVYGDNKIKKIDPKGVVTEYAGTGEQKVVNGFRTEASINSPWGSGPLAINPITGEIYFFDRETIQEKSSYYFAGYTYNLQEYDVNYIRKINTQTGMVSTVLRCIEGFFPGDSVNAKIGEIVDMTFDKNGVLYMVDQDNHAIWQYKNRYFSPVAGGGKYSMIGRGVDNGGYFYQGYVDGSLSTAKFALPSAIAINPVNNEILVSDLANNRIRAINLSSGRVYTLLGRTDEYSEYPSDGYPSSATFNDIRSLAVDSVGRLYFIDYETIRVYEPNGMVKTIAGTFYYGYGNKTDYDVLAKDASLSSPNDIRINPVNGRVTFNTTGALAELKNIKYSINPKLPKELKFDVQSGFIMPNEEYFSEKFTGTYTVSGYKDNGSSVSNQFKLVVNDSILGISTDTVRNVRLSSAKIFGTVNNLTSIDDLNFVKFQYKKLGEVNWEDIWIDNPTYGQDSVIISNLTPNTEYEYRISANSYLQYSKTYNGSVKKFKTPLASPIAITTTLPTDVKGTTATLGGRITDDKMDSIRTRGVIYSTSKANLTMKLGKVHTSGSDTGTFVSKLVYLRSSTTYYAVAFAANRFETTLATDTVTFTTNPVNPEMAATTTISSLRPTSVILGGNVLSDRGDTIIERGVLYSTLKSNLTYASAIKIKKGFGLGAYEVKTTSALVPGNTYYALAYAKNSYDLGLATDTLTFTTPKNLASVTTTPAFNIGVSFAKVGGEVTSDNGDSVTSRGVVYRPAYNGISDSTYLLNNPQYSSSFKIGSGIGAYDTAMVRLFYNQKYYYRAYATNESGTVYGDVMSFTTLPPPTFATVGDGSIGAPSQHSIRLSGVIDSDGRDSILEKGFLIDTIGVSPLYTNIVWNTEILNSIFQIKCGAGNSNFDTVFSQLASNSSYSVRAYAINSFGTSYGKLYTFNTPSETAGPFDNAPIEIPGRIEAENFDKGDDGVSFKEISYPSDKKVIENRGIGSSRRWDQANMRNVEEFRPTAVDIEATGDSVTRADGKNFQLAFTAKDEWTKYTVNVNAPTTKDYQFIIRYARGASADSVPGRVSIEVDGTLYADSVPIYGTGTWGTYSTAVADTIPLSPGLHEIKLNFIDAGVGSGESVGNINYIDVRESPIQRTGKLLNLNLNFGINANVRNVAHTAMVKGRELMPFAPYTIMMHSTPVVLATGNCDAQGNFSQLISIPRNTTPGKHSIDVFTSDTDGSNIAESAYITVDGSGVVKEIINAGLGNEVPSGLVLTYATNTDTDTTNTLIGTLLAIDYFRDIHTFTLTTGNGDVDNKLFDIQSDSLILSPVADYETRSVYRIRIRATDNGNNAFDTAIVITLVKGDDDVPGIKKPLIGQTAAVSITENKKDVTTVLAFDPKDMTLPYWYSISGGDDAEQFRISPSTGKLSFIEAPDYESPKDSGTNNTYNVIVKALNLFDQELSYSQTINVQVNDTLESALITNPFVRNIQLRSATVGATIVEDGSSITERGVIWGFDDRVTKLTLNTEDVGKVISGTGAGELSVDLTELSENSRYVFRVYAINALGTTYSEQISFTTLYSEAKAIVNYTSPTKLKQHSESLLEPNVLLGTIPAQEYQKVLTVAGTGASGAQEGQVQQATFNRPYGVAVNSLGQVFVADALNHRVRYFSVDDSVYLVAGSVAGVNNENDSTILVAGDAMFNQPTGIAIDIRNNVYISDKGNNQIRKISTNGKVSRIAGADKIGNGSNSGYVDSTGVNAKFNQPEGLAFDRNGIMLYVADKGNHVIRAINTITKRVRTYAGSGVAGSADDADLLNVTFNEPTGLYIDEHQNMYITEANSHKVRKINMDTRQITTLAGSGSAGSADGLGTSAQFNAPASIYGDGIGNVYVADLGNNKIRKIDSTGNVTTFAGTGISGETDGDVSVATFNAPYGLVIDKNASVIYVSHSSSNGNMIRSIGLGGYVLADSLPAGLKFNNRTGVISGAATEVKADTTYKVHYANIYGNDSTIINIEVVANNKKIVYATPHVFEAGTSITPITPLITGGTFTGGVNGTFSIAPTLPKGLSFDTATGVISGIPVERSNSTDYFVSGWDSTENVVTKLSIKVNGPRQLTVSGSQVKPDKQYDGTRLASVLIGTITGVENGHNVIVKADAFYENASVGLNKQIIVAYSITGSDSSKYLPPINDTLTNGEITPKQLTVTEPTITLKKTIDGNTTAAVEVGSLVGIISDDDVSVSATADYSTPDIGENKTITVVYTLGGADKDNYIKPADSVTTRGVIVDVVPSKLVYTPSSQVSGLNKAIVDMVPSSEGGKVIHYAITPALQPGLVFDTATGKISGMRTSLSGSGSGSVEYTITATNSGGSTTGKVTIIYNVPATNITLSKSNLYEGNQVGEVIGSLTTTDPDAGDTHTYSLVAGEGSEDNEFFGIAGNKLLAARVFDYKQRSSYSIRVRTTDQEGMSYEKVFTITVSEKPVVLGRSSDQYYGVTNGTPVISRGSQSQLQVIGNGISSVQWTPSTGVSNPNIINPIVRPKQTTTYTVIITNTAGSVTTLQITVEVKNDYLVEPQNIVTPNGDGINDFWVIKNLEEYPDNEVTIYDRAGKILYKIANYNQRWDGTSGGRKLATGTYYYILRFRDNPKALHKGFITLLHE